jgi:hypothetical protein
LQQRSASFTSDPAFNIAHILGGLFATSIGAKATSQTYAFELPKTMGKVGMKMRNAIGLVSIVAICALIAGIPADVYAESGGAAKLLWTGDFESGDFSQFKDHLYESGRRTTKRIVKSPTRAGKFATELTILDVDANHDKSRAELMTVMPDGGGRMQFEWDGPEYWVGFSFLFKEPIASTSTFFQIHAPNEPKGDPCDFAGNTFTVGGEGAASNGGVTKNVVVRVIEKGGVSAGKGSGSNNTVVYKYPFPLNEWQDYVVNFRLSTRGEGFYKVWKNGKAIYSKSGITNVNYRDSCGNLIPEDKRKHNGAHIGVYGSSVNGFRRVYYDEVRVAQGADGYDLVSPAGASSFVPEDALPKPPIVVDN